MQTACRGGLPSDTEHKALCSVLRYSCARGEADEDCDGCDNGWVPVNGERCELRWSTTTGISKWDIGPLLRNRFPCLAVNSQR